VHASLSHRQAGAGSQRVSGRMTKGKGKLAVLHEVLLSAAGLACFKAGTKPEHCLCSSVMTLAFCTSSKLNASATAS